MFETISLKDHVGHIIYQSTLHLLAVAFLWEYIIRILSFLEYPNLIRPFKKMIWYDTGHLTVSQFTSQNILKSLIPPPFCNDLWFQVCSGMILNKEDIKIELDEVDLTLSGMAHSLQLFVNAGTGDTSSCPWVGGWCCRDRFPLRWCSPWMMLLRWSKIIF